MAVLGLLVALALPGAPRGQPAPSSSPSEDGRRLFLGPTFLTGDPAFPEAAAIEVDGEGRIIRLHVGLPEPDPDLARVELPGVLAVPGLHDAHLHLAGLGRDAERVDLRGAESPAEVRDRIQAFLVDHPGVSPVSGRGWDQSRFPGREFPTWRDLEALGDRPIVLTRVDGHAIWVNRPLMEAAGIDRDTADPAGGRLLRDAAGDLTGVLVDNAVELVTDRLPEPTAEDRRRWLVVGAERAAEAGLVAVHDMGVSAAELLALREIDQAGALPVRVFVYLDASDPHALSHLDECRQMRGRIEVMGLKLFADGAMGSRGAALLEDYADEPGNRGLLLTSQEDLSSLARTAHRAGCQVAIHAIGDRGNRVALHVIDSVQGTEHHLRHRIEHAQLLHPDDFQLMQALGVVASMQPTHATSDMRWAETRVGRERLVGAYAWRTVLDRDIPLAFGSDAPVEDERPALGLYAAITRQDPEGQPPGGWIPGQRVDTAEALAAFSAGAAYAVHHEHELGTLTPGRFLDLTVLDRDPRAAPELWLQTTAVATVVEGQVVRGSLGE